MLQHSITTYNVFMIYKTMMQTRYGIMMGLVHKLIVMVVHLLAKARSKEREWLSILSYINAHGDSIPNFYFLKGKQFRHN